MYCIVEFENYMAQMIIMTRQYVACKNLAAKSDVNMCKFFSLHGLSVVSPILLLNYTSLPLWTYGYPTKTSTLIKVPFYSRH